MEVQLWVTVISVFVAFMLGMLVTALLANQRINCLYDEIHRLNRELEVKSTSYRPAVHRFQ